MIVYKYWAGPAGEIPPELWDLARRQNELWNALVWEWRGTRTAAGTLPECERKARWAQFNAWRDQEQKQYGLPQNWYWAVVQRFGVACREVSTRRKRAIALGANPATPYLGEPNPKPRVESVCWPWYYGQPDWKQILGNSQRFALEALPDFEAYADDAHWRQRMRLTHGTFGALGNTFRFRVLLHRELPTHLALKHVEWVGSRVNGTWEWALCFYVDGDHTVPAEDSPLVAGLDLGWRKMPGYWRFGMLRDNAGRTYELRLPRDMSSYRTRRNDYQPGSWEDVYALDERADALLEAVKNVAAGTGERVTGLKNSGLHRMRQNTESDALADLLEIWEREESRLRHIRNDAAIRLVRRRRDYYGQIAAWIATEYGEVRWEGDLDVGAMGAGKKEPALERADHARQIVAIGEFRAVLKHALSKRGRTLTDKETGYSTRTCFDCGEVADPGPSRLLTCPQGHIWDQDVNAARNILGDAEPAHARSLLVPEALQEYVVLLPKDQ